MRLSGTADAEETAIASKRNPTVRLVALPTRPCRPLSPSKKMSFPLTRRHKVFKYSNSCVDSILDWEFFSTETVPNHCCCNQPRKPAESSRTSCKERRYCRCAPNFRRSKLKTSSPILLLSNRETLQVHITCRRRILPFVSGEILLRQHRPSMQNVLLGWMPGQR